PPQIYTLSLHDALPILERSPPSPEEGRKTYRPPAPTSTIPRTLLRTRKETSTLSPRVRTKYSGWMLPPACLPLLRVAIPMVSVRSEEHTSELQSLAYLV